MSIVFAFCAGLFSGGFIAVQFWYAWADDIERREEAEKQLQWEERRRDAMNYWYGNQRVWERN